MHGKFKNKHCHEAHTRGTFRYEVQQMSQDYWITIQMIAQVNNVAGIMAQIIVQMFARG